MVPRRGSSVVERSPEEAGVVSSILTRGTMRGNSYSNNDSEVGPAAAGRLAVNEIISSGRGVVQLARTLALGARGPRFESGHPDQC